MSAAAETGNGFSSIDRKFFRQRQVLDLLRLYLDVNDTFVESIHRIGLITDQETENVKVRDGRRSVMHFSCTQQRGITELQQHFSNNLPNRAISEVFIETSICLKKQEAHQLEGPGKTPRHSLHTLCVCVILRQTVVELFS